MRIFEPFADRVLVLPDAVPVKTKGLAVPTNQQDKATEGTVVAAGPKSLKQTLKAPNAPLFGASKMCEWTVNEDGVAVGDRVQFPQYGGRKAMHNGVEHKLFRLEELEGRIRDVETDSQR